MRALVAFFLVAGICTFARADYKFGKTYRVKNDVMDFKVVELLIDGRFVGYVEKEIPPVLFSDRYYVYAACPKNKKTGKPDGYCLDWQIYDVSQKKGSELKLRGLGFNSMPAFRWPYIAYVQTPEHISVTDMQKNAIEVSCVVVDWRTKKVVAEAPASVSTGYFEEDTPWSFVAPVFTREQSHLRVTCSEHQGAVIATVEFSDTKPVRN